jgi:glycosyltransferase involved in cell wall biosynthesis
VSQGVSRAYLPREQLASLLRRSLKYATAPAPRLRRVRALPDREPLTSVIIPTYNWSRVLRIAIHGVLWQTEEDFELLVIGDGCTDDSEDVVRAFGDARIRWHNLPRNSGNQSAPNNVGLERARGTYVAYCGHDDVWHPDHLRTLLAAARAAGAGVASSLVEMIGPAGTSFRTIVGIYPPGGYDGVEGLPPSGLLHRREIAEGIGGWRDYREIWRNPDTDFVYRAWEAGVRFVSTGELTAFKFPSALRRNSYRDRPSHEQATYRRRIQDDRWFMLREVLAIAWVHLRRLPMRVPIHATPPDPHTPGWQVTQFRKYRGLE